MFVRFFVQNYRSILEEQELSLVAANTRDRGDSAIPLDPPIGSILRVAAIYGANASGKTNVLRALRFFQGAVRNSQRRWEPDEAIPVQSFAFGQTDEVVTRMSLDFVVGGIRHEYGFTSDGKTFLSEWLHVYTHGRKQIWFDRTGTTVRFGPALQTSGSREINNAISKIVRPNSLLLSAAVQNNYDMLVPVYNAIAQGWTGVMGPRESLMIMTAKKASENEESKARITRLMKGADLGLLGFEFVEEEAEEQFRKMIDAMLSVMPSDGSVPKDPYKRPKVSFVHQAFEGAHGMLDASEESAGTLSYFALLGPICDALENGSFIYIDEIESSLHPNLAAALVRLFNNPRSNPKGAQLVFTTHEVTLLTDCSLRRDQIWFTEKSHRGTTTLFPLSDFHLRKDERIGKGYLQGRFGGVPNIDQLLLDVEIGTEDLNGTTSLELSPS